MCAHSVRWLIQMAVPEREKMGCSYPKALVSPIAVKIEEASNMPMERKGGIIVRGPRLWKTSFVPILLWLLLSLVLLVFGQALAGGVLWLLVEWRLVSRTSRLFVAQRRKVNALSYMKAPAVLMLKAACLASILGVPAVRAGRCAFTQVGVGG